MRRTPPPPTLSKEAHRREKSTTLITHGLLPPTATMSHSKYTDAKTWKFYAVHRVGVFDDFDQCQAATKKNDLGYSNKFKGFESFDNACTFVNIEDVAEAQRCGASNCGVKTVTKDKSKGKAKAKVPATPPSTTGALFVAPQLFERRPLLLPRPLHQQRQRPWSRNRR